MRASTLRCFVIVRNNEIVGRNIHDTEDAASAHMGAWFASMHGPAPTMPGLPPQPDADRARDAGYSVQHAIIHAHPRLNELDDRPPIVQAGAILARADASSMPVGVAATSGPAPAGHVPAKASAARKRRPAKTARAVKKSTVRPAARGSKKRKPAKAKRKR